MSGPNASRQPRIAGNGCVLPTGTTGRSKLPLTTAFRSDGGAADAPAGAATRTAAATAASKGRTTLGKAQRPGRPLQDRVVATLPPGEPALQPPHRPADTTVMQLP